MHLGGLMSLRLVARVFKGMNIPKTQYFVDPTNTSKGKRVAKPKLKTKRTKPAPSQKPASHARKPQPSKSRKPALTRQQLKEQGLCRCGQVAISQQTRCPTCAEKHRAWNPQDTENRRRAKGAKPRPRIDERAIEQVRQELAEEEARKAAAPKRVHSEKYNKERAQARARLRAERISLGLCVQCTEPTLGGQTRCPDCTIKHRQYHKRARIKAKITSGFAQ